MDISKPSLLIVYVTYGETRVSEKELTFRGHMQLVVEQRHQTPDTLTITLVFFDVTYNRTVI